MLISEITTAGAIPTLEATLRFAAQRQSLLANNIATFTLPDYRPKDVSPVAFQSQLREAVEARRSRNGGQSGRLPLRSSREVAVTPGGGLSLRPSTPSGNILFHDRNDRDLERTMADLAENLGVFRTASDLLRNRFESLRAAIAERP